MLGQQFPTVRSVNREEVREIITATPLDKRIVGQLRRDRVVDRLRTQLRQMREAGGPAERNLSALRISPVTLSLATPEKVALEPLHVVAVGADEADGAARI